MATILLSAAGAAIGSGIGGGVLGLSSAVIGRAIGASIGRAIDQKILGGGSQAHEVGRIERYRVQGAGEGQPIQHVFGTTRIAGHVIWSTRFKESVVTEGGGKGTQNRKPVTRSYSYSVSLAVGLCQGEISGVGRVWADGRELPRSALNMRVYRGDETQQPDPKIEAVEGAGRAPAYRGLAYVVFEDISLEQFGNRVPQFNFEVTRPAQLSQSGAGRDVSQKLRAVSLIPGTGEYALATTPVYLDQGFGKKKAVNLNAPQGRPDLVNSLDQLQRDVPGVGSAALVVSWFGDDLRCNRAQVTPKVEQSQYDGLGRPWKVAGAARGSAQVVPQQDGRSVYGGTPSDDTVVEALVELKARGLKPVFYPFVLMDQLAGNGLADPWRGATGQPQLPWRGRITLSKAPGLAGSPDQSAAAVQEVAAFFGSASVADFAVNGSDVTYSGPDEWSYRRMILHYAHLCAAAGGVDSFCVGSELRGLTQIRGGSGDFPAVDQLVQLVTDVRAILGADTKIGYAADWSEYFGYHPNDGSGDVYFHLDPLWAHPELDFIGIDNYMPLSDWRDGAQHADASWGAIYDRAYLQANIEGGEGYDWYYADQNAVDAQLRNPIKDSAHGEDWVFRYKDIRNWWSLPHHQRIDGVRQANATAWVPMSKPIWFTEFGCAAIDKGANQPNKFLDAKSSESNLPRASNGKPDPTIQAQYLHAMLDYWDDPANNPISPEYNGPMVDVGRAFAWAWDARPYPQFPTNRTLWTDGANYEAGHWLNGRVANRSLANVVDEICALGGLGSVDTRRLYGTVSGYALSEFETGRKALQPLQMAFGFGATEADGKVRFRMQARGADTVLKASDLAVSDGGGSARKWRRETNGENFERVRVGYVERSADYAMRYQEALRPEVASGTMGEANVNLVLSANEARALAERWVGESEVAQETVRFSLPPSHGALRCGDLLAFEASDARHLYRVDRTNDAGVLDVEATRVDFAPAAEGEIIDHAPGLRPYLPPAPVDVIFADLPLFRPDTVAHAPWVGVAADPWPGNVAVYASDVDANYAAKGLVSRPTLIGQTTSALAPAASGLLDRGAPLMVSMAGGQFESCSLGEMLNGRNLLAIGDGSQDRWEMIQFQRANLVGVSAFELSGRLRGRYGTEHHSRTIWPVGSYVMVLPTTEFQLDFGAEARGLIRHVRIGPAAVGYDDPSYLHSVRGFDGIGERPFAPVHLRHRHFSNGDRAFDWVRRTRVGGDSWQASDVPLGEEAERYRVRIVAQGQVVRQVVVQDSSWIYAQADQMVDGLTGEVTIGVAQISAVFGDGVEQRISINV